ncbi:MAG: tetratricopeptide repeat protein [bacterium]|nr:tetratricopeptide repeat protein [bacterium]
MEVPFSPLRRHAVLPACIFAFAFAIRLLYLAEVSDTVVFETLIGDGRGYDAWAQRIAGLDTKTATDSEAFFQAPFYPYFLAWIYSVFGHDTFAVRIVQTLFGSLACAAIACATAIFFSRRTGYAAGALLCLYPFAFYFDGIVQKTSLTQFFGAWLLLLLARMTLPDGPRLHRALTTGVVLGGLGLLRENALAFAPFCMIWILQHASAKRRVVHASAFALGIAIALSPVAMRNYQATGIPLPTTYQFGANFYLGNHAGATGLYVPLRPGRGDASVERQDAQDLAESALGRRLSGPEVSRYWTDRTLTDIANDVPGWLRLLAWKWALVWNAFEIPDTDSWRAYADFSFLLATLGSVFHFGVLCPLAAFGIAMSWDRRKRLWIFYALALTVASSVAAFLVYGRYRFPLVILLVPFAAHALTGWREVLAASRTRQLACLACAMVTALLVNYPLDPIPADPRAVTYNSIGASILDAGDVRRAQAQFERALEINPSLWWAQVNLAKTLHRQGKLADAVPHYRKALAAHPDPAIGGELGLALVQLMRPARGLPLLQTAVDDTADDAALQNGLGAAHLLLGQLVKAEQHLRIALQLDPDNREARLNLETLMGLKQRAGTGVQDADLRPEPERDL